MFQVWDDQKKKVKKKCADVNEFLRSTGGADPGPYLNHYEKRVLDLMGGWVRIVGFTQVIDPLEVSLF